jgi:N utilization substance protein B
MGKRREARERAVQFLFQHDLNPPEDLEAALNLFWESQRAVAIAAEKDKATWGQRIDLPPATAEESVVRVFADPLIRGTIEHRDAIDQQIQKHAKNWDLHRMAVVDRNVLRLAIYEMLHRDDIPPVVSINEAVDIATTPFHSAFPVPRSVFESCSPTSIFTRISLMALTPRRNWWPRRNAMASRPSR